jgi:hypothetical protein
VQPGYDSRIADSLGSRLGRGVRHLSREHLTVGIILLVLGVFAFRISPWLAWFTVGSGLLLLTWDAQMRGTYRGLLYFVALLPVLHRFNSTNEFLFSCSHVPRFNGLPNQFPGFRRPHRVST